MPTTSHRQSVCFSLSVSQTPAWIAHQRHTPRSQVAAPRLIRLAKDLTYSISPDSDVDRTSPSEECGDCNGFADSTKLSPR